MDSKINNFNIIFQNDYTNISEDEMKMKFTVPI